MSTSVENPSHIVTEEFLEKLPITEYLTVELLVAKVRLGYDSWNFPLRHQKILDSLRRKGVLTYSLSEDEQTYHSRLTKEALEVAADPQYVPPILMIEQLINTQSLPVAPVDKDSIITESISTVGEESFLPKTKILYLRTKDGLLSGTTKMKAVSTKLGNKKRHGADASSDQSRPGEDDPSNKEN